MLTSSKLDDFTYLRDLQPSFIGGVSGWYHLPQKSANPKNKGSVIKGREVSRWEKIFPHLDVPGS